MVPPIIVEDGKTFRQNALNKALTISRFFDGLVLADDSGLQVDVLDGRPGVRSSRFAREFSEKWSGFLKADNLKAGLTVKK